MRIIAGEWRGRAIKAPPGETTRPSSDRLRETLFSMLASRLGSFEGLSAADLFAGSGALGLEALSRGCASCLFVEQDKRAVEAIRANIKTLEAGPRASGKNAVGTASQRKHFLQRVQGSVDGPSGREGPAGRTRRGHVVCRRPPCRVYSMCTGTRRMRVGQM